MTNEYLFIFATRLKVIYTYFYADENFPNIRYHFQNNYFILRGNCIIIVSYHNHFNLSPWVQHHVGNINLV
jgi:hypothetical protein